MQTTTFMKVLSGLLMMAFFGTLHAQDIIITKDAQKIEAKILEVSNSEIKYKKQSNLEGPTFILGVEELNSIIYANGEVQVFGGSKGSEKEMEETKPILVEQQSAGFVGENITRVDKTWYLNGQAMNEREYLDFLQKNCPTAYEYHLDGLKKEKLGKIFCGVAIGCSVASIALLVTGSVLYEDAFLYAGCGCALVADGFCAASIPLWIIGAKRWHSSHELYNQQCMNKVSLNLQSGRNGFGLALRF